MLKTIKVSTTKTYPDKTEEKRATSFEYDIPSNLDEAREKYGETLVYESFFDAMRIALQNPARKTLENCAKGTTEAEWKAAVAATMSSYVFGVKQPRGGTRAPSDPAGELSVVLPTLPVERQREILRLLNVPEEAIEKMVTLPTQEQEQEQEDVTSDDETEHEIVGEPSVPEETPRRRRGVAV